MKNISTVIKKTANDLNLPEDQVNAVIMEYWKTIHHNLVNLESTTISVKHVGNFTISRFKLKIYIKTLITKCRKAKVSTTYNNIPVDESERNARIENYKEKIRKLLEKRNVLANHYYKKAKLDELKKNPSRI